MKINNREELRNIATKHSADIDYKDFVKIYRECTKERILFWQSILRYLQVILKDLGKLCFNLLKMTVADQIKILNRKVMQNEVQSDLDRKAAKITAFSSNNLDKYEYLTGEDLDYKPSAVEQARFEYSPLAKIFNKGLKKRQKRRNFEKTEKYWKWKWRAAKSNKI